MKTKFHHQSKLSVVFLFIFFLGTSTASAQWIWHTQQVPDNPTDVDTLKSFVTALFPFNVDFNTIPMTR